MLAGWQRRSVALPALPGGVVVEGSASPRRQAVSRPHGTATAVVSTFRFRVGRAPAVLRYDASHHAQTGSLYGRGALNASVDRQLTRQK